MRFAKRSAARLAHTVSANNDTFSIATLPQNLGNTGNFGEARALFDLFSDSLTNILAYYNNSLEIQRDLAVELNYPTYLELEAYLYNFNPRLIERLTADLLTQTAPIYQAVFNRLVSPYTNRRLPNLYLADIYRVDERYSFTDEIPAADFAETAGELLDGLGISTARQPGLSIVLDDSTTASFPATVAIVDIPGDVRLTAAARAGLAPHQEYLGQMAIAQAALFNQDPSDVFKVLYHSPTTGAFQLLFQRIWENNIWIDTHFSASSRTRNRLIDYQVFRQLVNARIAAAIIKYESRFFAMPAASIDAENTTKSSGNPKNRIGSSASD